MSNAKHSTPQREPPSALGSNEETGALDYKDQIAERTTERTTRSEHTVAYRLKNDTPSGGGPAFSDQFQSVTRPNGETTVVPLVPGVPVHQGGPSRSSEPVASGSGSIGEQDPTSSIATCVLKRRHVVFVLVALVLVSAATVGGVCGAGICAGSNDNESMEPLERGAGITEFINEISLKQNSIDYPIAASVATPEDLALGWLIDDDPFQFSVDSASDRFRLRQRYALVSLWFQRPETGRSWMDSSNWLRSNECEWFGIECTEMDLRGDVGAQNVVTSISMANNNLQSQLPADLALLGNLVELTLASNLLTSSIPDDYGFMLTKLQIFDVSQNSLSGTLPTSIGRWQDLKEGQLWNNTFTGILPSSYGSLTALEDFSVWKNQLNGTLPDSIGNWVNVSGLVHLHDNNFTGSIPSSIGAWKSLREVRLSFNDLTGTIPDSIGQWESMRSAHFHFNSLAGSMPASICSVDSVTDLIADCNISCACCTSCN